MTSADAIVRFERAGAIETVLIEWKYTEVYGQPIRAEGNETRKKRYLDKVFSPNGPIRTDLGLSIDDFFWEPFYQLLRQQLLAWRMEKAKEQGATRVTVLHISPRENTSLHKVTSPRLRRFGDDAFEVFRSLLAEPDSFRSRTIDEVFGAIVRLKSDEPEQHEWSKYLLDRYALLLKGPPPSQLRRQV